MNIYSSRFFQRKYKKLVKNDRALIASIEKKFTLFFTDPQHPSLRLHKLSGNLSDSWSISIKSNVRVVFEYIDDGILLTNIGSHDEVY